MEDFPSDRQSGTRSSGRASAADDLIREATMKRQDAEVDIGSLFSSMWRQKILIAGFVFVAMVIATAYVYRVTPMFRSTAVVMLDKRESQVIDYQSVVSGLGSDYLSIQAEVEVLRSRSLAERVVVAAKLEQNPYFNPLLAVETEEASLWNPFNLLFMALDLFKSTIRGVVAEDELITSEDLDQTYWVRQRAIDTLLGSLSVEPVGETYVYALIIEVEDPTQAAFLANKMAEMYILDQLEVKFEATQQATTWLSGRVAELKVQLEAAEAAVEDFTSNTTLISEDSLAGLSRQIKDLREREIELNRQGEDLNARSAAIDGLLQAGDYHGLASALSSPRLIGLASDITAVGQDPSRADLIARFEAELSRQVQRMQLETERSASQAQAVRATINDLERQFDAQSADLVQLRQLQREAEASRLIYEYFLNRMKETSVQQGVHQADSRILSPAVISLRPSYPNKTSTVMLAAIFGAVIGALFVLIRDQLNQSFRTSDDLEGATGLPVLGSIPIAPIRKRRALLEYAVTKSSSSMVEAIRNMRTGVLMANVDRTPQVIMLTSSLPKEGKTTTSLLLAQNAAALGKSVLLMECDLRRRTFRSYFAEKPGGGLLSVLSDAMTFDEAVLHDAATGMDVLMGEETKTNAADVFSSRRFEAFLETMRERYDMIVIDTPPVLAVPDARVIAPLADAIIYCVRWNVTHRDLVRTGLQMFSQIKVRVTGLALTQIDQRKLARYGYGGYGYYYRASSRYYLN
ncbi:MAG: succinoglycan biosynthesis transport protein ExoP [Paracoccaceae bacterium]